MCTMAIFQHNEDVLMRARRERKRRERNPRPVRAGRTDCAEHTMKLRIWSTQQFLTLGKPGVCVKSEGKWGIIIIVVVTL